MSLTVTKVRQRSPALVISGPGGCGKTTLASTFPSPLFMLTEHPGNLLQADTLNEGQPYQSFDGFMSDLRLVFKEKHDYRTLVIDAADGLETLINDKICQEGGQTSVAAFPFGKGYAESLSQWNRFLSALDKIREGRGMTVIIIAHVEVSSYEDPAAQTYSRWSIKLYKKLAMRTHDWSEAHLFCGYQTAIKREEQGFGRERARGIGTGERVVWTEERPSHMAKNRFSMPEQLPMDFPSLNEYLQLGE